MIRVRCLHNFNLFFYIVSRNVNLILQNIFINEYFIKRSKKNVIIKGNVLEFISNSFVYSLSFHSNGETYLYKNLAISYLKTCYRLVLLSKNMTNANNYTIVGFNEQKCNRDYFFVLKCIYLVSLRICFK